ncbi:hypothetical protein PR202_gb02228 [Eleusine coracana subsp. coracana]|uniref:Uncharacterized protein n=1 Tax=Eleusine coracana subsp. coracana TaxID=191504 RepID=A0AAV5DYT0_ELECO|nr:hypothetical protein QOZ80_5BG0410240 [Eleusine coracana subsp. coracana]GJN15327.1 hypothetical protein PR202_gb02228 [Eleusine coracana subsp. coracana]
MLQCESSSSSGMAGSALLRLYRMVRAGEVVALVALVSWSSWYVPSLLAAALRLAGSLLLNARFVFVLGNAIVLLLFALSRHDDLSSPSSSPSSSTSEQQQPAAASSSTTPLQQQQAPSSSSVPPPVAADAAATTATSFPAVPFTTTTPPSSSISMEAAAASFAMPAAEPVIARADAVLLEDKQQPAAAVRKLARAPRRSRSEKMGPRPRRAASPELRRCESENGRRRRSSVTARDAEACWGREDADEFRRTVEAFIARQTRFHREESMSMAGHCEVAPAFTGALAVVE